MTGPRVLFVIPGKAQGSSMIFARRQAEMLRKEGLTVECFYLRSRTSPRVLAAEWRRFRDGLRTFRPDVVHAHFGTVTAMFAVLATRKIPVLITFRGSDLNPVPTARTMRAFAGRVLSQLAALGADHIICVSRGLKSRLLWRSERVTVLPSGVDTAVFCPIEQSEARRALGWNLWEKVVLFNAGHDARNKRLDLALATSEVLQHDVPGTRLEVLAGDVPPVRLPLYMNAADCLLVTSDAEGSPTVVQEAIATNLPIVSVNVGDVPERVHGLSGAIIAERNPRALANAVASVIRSGQRSNGRDRSREICSARIAGELAHLYRQLAARRSAQSFSTWNTTLSSPQ